MTKKIKKLEKETTMYRSRWESSNKALLEMAEEVTRPSPLGRPRLSHCGERSQIGQPSKIEEAILSRARLNRQKIKINLETIKIFEVT